MSYSTLKLIRLELLFFLLTSFFSLSQDSMVVVSTSDWNVVHRNVPNLIKVGFNKMTEPYYIECLGCDITNIDTLGNYLPKHQFLVTPGPSRTVYVDLWSNSDTNNRVRMARLEFLNLNLPDPSIFIGGAGEEGNIYWKQTALFVKYPPEILLNYQFSILNWKVKIKRKHYSGIGSHLTPQVLESIKKMKEGAKMEIEIETIGEDNETRKLETVFYRAPDEWYENISE